MDITTFSDVELKAIDFEAMKQIQVAQQNLAVVEQELQKRAKAS